MPVPDTATPYESRPADLGGVIAQPLLPADPNAPFFLVHFKDNWEVGLVDGEPYWLPQLQRDWIVPGCNGKRAVKRGQEPQMAYDQSHIQMMRQGATIIPHTVGCAGVSNYLAQIRCKSPKTGVEGLFYHEAWETPRTPREGKRVKFAFNHELYNRFRFELVADGHIAPPNPDVVSEKIGRAKYHRERKENELHGKVPEPVQEKLLAQADQVVEALVTAEIPAVERPKPVKRGKAAKAEPAGGEA